jgi:addiction module HigA family antidote
MLRSSIIIAQKDMVSAVTARIKKKLATGVAAVCPAVECTPVIEPKKRDYAAHRLTHSTLPSTRREKRKAERHADRNGQGRSSEPVRGKLPARAVNRRRALPDRITAHPGEVLREEFLKPLGLSVNGLAAGLRVPASRIGAIINGERSVTPDTALRLGRFFCNSPEFWINLQAMHDLTRAHVEFGHAIERDIRPLAQ